MATHTIGGDLAPGMVRITVDVHPSDDHHRVLKVNGERLKVSVELHRCETCAALVLSSDESKHANWHARMWFGGL